MFCGRSGTTQSATGHPRADRKTAAHLEILVLFLQVIEAAALLQQFILDVGSLRPHGERKPVMVKRCDEFGLARWRHHTPHLLLAASSSLQQPCLAQRGACPAAGPRFEPEQQCRQVSRDARTNTARRDRGSPRASGFAHGAPFEKWNVGPPPEPSVPRAGGACPLLQPAWSGCPRPRPSRARRHTGSRTGASEGDSRRG